MNQLTPNIIAAVDLLNSYVRAPDARLGTHLREAIYRYKNAAIATAVNADQAECRRIVTTVKCRDCGGSGRYVDSWGHEHDHCRACRSSGKAELQFIVTRFLPDGPAWHTPLIRWPLCKVRSTELPFEVDSYQPNPPGRPAAIEQVAAALVDVERWFCYSGDVVHNAWETGTWYDDRFGVRAYRYWVDYALDLGRMSAQACCWCETPLKENACGYAIHTGCLEWTDYLCDACHAKHGWHAPVPKMIDLCAPALWQWLVEHGRIVREFVWKPLLEKERR